MRAFNALPAAVRIAAGATAVVAIASAVLSWDALQWGAQQLGVDPRLAFLFPVAVDGTIATGTAAALALRSAPRRVRAYVWSLLGAAIAASVIGNASHAHGGDPLHRAGAAVPAAALAACLHLLVILVRAQPVPAPAGRRTAVDQVTRTRRRRAGARKPEPPRLVDGRMVSAGHARKLRAAQEGAA